MDVALLDLKLRFSIGFIMEALSKMFEIQIFGSNFTFVMLVEEHTIVSKL